jgi:hypothetical protein
LLVVKENDKLTTNKGSRCWMMLNTFTYRLSPTRRQKLIIGEQLEELRWLWNTLLAEHKQAWEERRESA